MKNFFEAIGLRKVKSVRPYNYDSNSYDLNSDINKIKAHKEFLKSTLDEENRRLEAIENKTNQLVSQTSVVFSLLSLTIPIIIDKTGDTGILFRLALVIFVLISFSFYFLAIFNALKNFNVNNFNYSVPSPSNVLDFKDKTEEEFEAELVRDYLYSINVNIGINNVKATNLLHSNRAFKFGNIFTATIVILITCLVLFFNTNEKENKTEKKANTIIVNDKNAILNIVINKDTILVRK